MNRYFITGIGTGVGKTIVAAILTEALQADYWKPIQSGTVEGTDSNSVASCVSNATSQFLKEAYSLKEPASPHLAAALEDVEIDMDAIQLPSSSNNNLIIEGAGGLLVPLNSKHYVIDLAKRFDAEVILVCRNYLGCINHSLLSIDYLLRHNFKIKGLVLNGDYDPLVRSAIINYADLPVLAEIKEIGGITKSSIAELARSIKQF